MLPYKQREMIQQPSDLHVLNKKGRPLREFQLRDARKCLPYLAVPFFTNISTTLTRNRHSIVCLFSLNFQASHAPVRWNFCRATEPVDDSVDQRSLTMVIIAEGLLVVPCQNLHLTICWPMCTWAERRDEWNTHVWKPHLDDQSTPILRTLPILLIPHHRACQCCQLSRE